MRSIKKDVGLGHTIVAAALLAVFGLAQAQGTSTDASTQLTQPTSSVSVGAAVANGDSYSRSLFGQYNGLREHDSNLLLDFDYVKRDSATGTWTIVHGRDLGLDTPELGFTYDRQGDWKLGLNYEQIDFHDPYTINTGMQGAGSTTPSIVVLSAPGTGQDVNLELKRKRLGVNVDKWITSALQLQVNFKDEDKTGAVEWGRGFACGSIYPTGTWNGAGNACSGAAGHQWALLMLPQPVDSRTDQIEAKLNYHTSKLFLTGGYYGTFYRDNVGNLTPNMSGVTNYYNIAGNPTALDPGFAATLGSPMALWPDNQAHQFYLDGTYAFTQRLRSTFNLSYEHATQDDSFSSMGLIGAPPGVNSLNAVVDTTRAQFGLTAQPIPKLSLVADLRYENRDDKTPVQCYSAEPANTPENNCPGVAASATESLWTNSPISNHKIIGKLEGTYQLPAHLRGTLGIDYKSVNRDLPVSTYNVIGLTALREKTEETTYRGELRRTFSDTFAGSIGVAHSRRTGSDWYLAENGPTVSSSALAAANTSGALPYYLLDRTRDKARATAEWTPTDRTSLQAVLEYGRDHYDSPIYTGMQGSNFNLYSLDATYQISYKWSLTGYVSRTDQTMQVNQPSTGDYRMGMRDREDAVGVTLAGKPIERLEVGANLAYINDQYSYNESMGPAASAANIALLQQTGGLPDVTFRETRLNLYGKYALDKHSAVRVDLLHQEDKLDEWTWGYAGVPFTYSDNTTVLLDPNQKVTVLMARYIYSFR